MLKKRHLHAKVMKVAKEGYFNVARERPGQLRKTLQTHTSPSSPA